MDLLARAYAERPRGWVSDDVFLAHARSVASEAELAAVHAGDLYLACACAHGVAEAIEVLEREHFSRIREFAASVTTSPELVKELAQQLRAKLLVPDGNTPPRIATYSGRGSLGGWVRVTAVRLARDLGRSERALERAHDRAGAEPLREIDPELAYLTQTYGNVVNAAFVGALAALDGETRALLKLHYVDGLTIEQVGAAFQKSRATAARMLASARVTLVHRIRERLVGTVGVREDEADSLLAFVRSQLDVSLSRMLR